MALFGENNVLRHSPANKVPVEINGNLPLFKLGKDTIFQSLYNVIGVKTLPP